jgi:hypothetical protein
MWIEVRIWSMSLTIQAWLARGEQGEKKSLRNKGRELD